ncbi:hypothetical protein [Luteibacter sp. RCC_6_2]|uniref:hypothetical protein n=1 Tax=Luteibacter sp. RCC_6_2 TaxID=3239223 RepID=UPI003523DBF6
MSNQPAPGAFLRPNRNWLVALVIVSLTIAMYAPGLHGPYLLDDIGNLKPLKSWVDGTLAWQGVVLDNRSGPGGRPLSMLTFLVNAWFDPALDTLAFKATNLAIHLACGGLALVLSLFVFQQVGIERRRGHWLATFVAVAWLWLPMHVSTVLYVIQRMAQLATLLTFATLVTYMAARRRMVHGSRASVAAVWIVVPILTLLATAAKETGVLALPLAAALEYMLFPDRARPRNIKIFFGLTVALPIFSALLFILFRPDWILGGYAARDFTLVQRLLTEPRVLWSYLQTTFFPVGPRMGLFHDNYPVSITLGTPISTLLSLIAWICVVGVAIMWRRRIPLFTLGVAGYLIAHALEAGPIGLELYFEHRNYGAALFALIAIVGLLRFIVTASIEKPRVRRVLLACGTTCLAIYGLGTWSQAEGWKDAQTFYSTQYGYNPDSPRLLSNLTGHALAAGDLEGALAYIAKGERAAPASEQATATIWRFVAYCTVNAKPAPEDMYGEFQARARGRITTYAMVGWELLAERISEGCKTVNGPRVALIALQWLDATPQPSVDQPVWRTRYNSGRIIAESGNLAVARDVIKRAWIDSGRNNGIGVILFQLDASLNDIAGCREVLAFLSRAEGGADRRLTLAIRTFREALENGAVGGDSK